MNQLNDFQKEKVKEKMAAWAFHLNKLYESMFDIETIIGKQLPINMEAIAELAEVNENINNPPIVYEGNYEDFMKEAEEFVIDSPCANGMCEIGDHNVGQGATSQST